MLTRNWSALINITLQGLIHSTHDEEVPHHVDYGLENNTVGSIMLNS